MGHERLAVVEPGRAVEAAFHLKAKQRVCIEGRRVHDAFVLQVALVYVAAKPHGAPVFELGKRKLLQTLDGQVQVAHPACLDDVAQAPHRVGAHVGLVGGGRRYQADVVARVHAQHLAGELLRGEAPGDDQLGVAIAQAHVEFARRLPKGHDEHVLHIGHIALLHHAQLFCRRAPFMRLAQITGAFAQVAREIRVNLVGVFRARRLGIGLLGHKAILLHESGEHVPLPAVVYRPCQDEGHLAAVERLVERIENLLEKPVALLQFVEKQSPGLRELEVVELVALDHLLAHRVQRRKHPAAPRTLLIAARALLQLHIETQRVFRQAFRHARSTAHPHRADRVFRDDTRPVLGKRGEDLLESIDGKLASRVLLLPCRHMLLATPSPHLAPGCHALKDSAARMP